MLACGIDAGVGGQIGDTAGQLLGVGHQENIAFAQPLERFELAALAHPDLVRGYRRAPQPRIDLEDAVGDGAELLCRCEMLRIGVGVLAGSENGDYIYGKRRLREIDRRISFLSTRLESAEVVDPKQQKKLDQVFFGASVTYANERGSVKTITIVGVDEADLSRGQLSWESPVARALMKAHEGDVVEVRAPSGVEQIEVLEIRYGGGRGKTE